MSTASTRSKRAGRVVVETRGSLRLVPRAHGCDLLRVSSGTSVCQTSTQSIDRDTRCACISDRRVASRRLAARAISIFTWLQQSPAVRQPPSWCLPLYTPARRRFDHERDLSVRSFENVFTGLGVLTTVFVRCLPRYLSSGVYLMRPPRRDATRRAPGLSTHGLAGTCPVT